MRQRDRCALASRGRVLDAAFDQLERSVLAAAPSGEDRRRVPERGVAGDFRDRIRLVEEDGEGADLAGERNRSGGQRLPRRVVPDVRRDAAGKPQPAHVALACRIGFAKRLHRSLESWRGGCVGPGEPRRQSVQEEVDRPRWMWGRERRERGLCDFDDSTGAPLPAGEDGGP